MSDSIKPRFMSRLAGAVALIASTFMPAIAPAQATMADAQPNVAQARILAGLLHEGWLPAALPAAIHPEARLDSDGVTLVVRARWSSTFLYGLAAEAVALASPPEAPAFPAAADARDAPLPPADRLPTGEGGTQKLGAPSPAEPMLAAEADPERMLAEPGPAGEQQAAASEDPALWALTADGQPCFGVTTEAERHQALAQAAAWAVADRAGSHPFGYLGWDDGRQRRALHLLRDILKAQEPGKGWRQARSQVTGVTDTGKVLGIEAEVAATTATFWALPPQHRLAVLCTTLKAGHVANLPQREIAQYVVVSEKTMAVARRRGEPLRRHSSQRWVSKLKAEAIERARADYAARLTQTRAGLPAA